MNRVHPLVNIFSRCENKLRPLDAEKGLASATGFMDLIKMGVDRHITAIDDSSSGLRQFEMALHSSGGRAPKDGTTELRKSIRARIEQKLANKTVSELGVKVALQNLPVFYENSLQEQLGRNRTTPHPQTALFYQDDLQRLIDDNQAANPKRYLSKERSTIWRFNAENAPADEVETKYFISINKPVECGLFLRSWQQSLNEHRLNNDLCYDVAENLEGNNRQITIHRTTAVNEEQISSVLKTFSRYCPKEQLDPIGVATAFEQQRGITYAYDHVPLNSIYEAMHYETPEKHQIRSNQHKMISGAIQLAYELGYYTYVKGYGFRNAPRPSDIYFETLNRFKEILECFTEISEK